MSFTRSTTNTTVHQNMPDYPSGEGYTTSQLKTAFDAPATGLKSDLNGLMTELEDTSSASNIGAAAIVSGDDSDGNVQAKLEKLQEELEGIALGSIPDGSITQAKINGTYEATLAKKNGTLQTNLNTEKLNGKTEAQLKSAFLTMFNPTTVSFTALAPNSGTATETKSISTSGARYYLLVNTYYKVILYDAKTQKFVFSIPIDGGQGYSDGYAVNTTSIKLYGISLNSRSSMTLSATYSSNTLTLKATKNSTSMSSQAEGGTPAGTITVFELGGMV